MFNVLLVSRKLHQHMNPACTVQCVPPPTGAHLHSGLVELDVVQPLLVADELALQFVHADGFLAQGVQLVAVGPS